MRGSHLSHAKFSLQSMKFSLRYAMKVMFGMFSFAFQVLSAQKCGAVTFPKFESACRHARPLRYLDALFYIEHMHGMHVCA